MRNLDMVALRAFAAVAETGGITRAASVLNLTQSAVSMQIKRLEGFLDVELLERSGRGISLTTSGEKLLGYARRILALNDEAWHKLTSDEFMGEIRLGVPHDIVPRAIPQTLRAFAAEFPRMQVRLMSSFTTRLKEQLVAGEADIIITTEEGRDAGGETLLSCPLVWVGAPDGRAARKRPLPIAFEDTCIFRTHAIAALDAADIPWEWTVRTDNSRSIEATVGADLAVHAMMDGMVPDGLVPVGPQAGLPHLQAYNVNLYRRHGLHGEAAERLIDLLRQIYPEVMPGAGRQVKLAS